jgi:hypothetical protein
MAKLGKKRKVLSLIVMKTSHLRWLIAGIGALLLMSLFTVYLILRDRQKIDASFATCRGYLDSLYAVRNRERELSYHPDFGGFEVPLRSVKKDTTFRNMRIREAELTLQSEHLLTDTQEIVRASDNKKLLWTSLMGVAGLIGLAIIRAGRKNISS